MKKKKLRPTVVGMGIIIEGMLYKPIEYEGDPWDQCEVCDCQKPCFYAGADIAYCEGFGEYALHRMGKVFDVSLDCGITLTKIPKGIIVNDMLYEATRLKPGDDDWNYCAYCDSDCNGKHGKEEAYCNSFGEDDILRLLGKVVGMTIGIPTEEKKPHGTKEKELHNTNQLNDYEDDYN